MNKKVYVVGGERGWGEFFRRDNISIAHNILDADFLQFTGGADVTPELYNENNYASQNDLDRDIREAGFFNVAIRLNIPMAGICRGGQFLNVMCGGRMIQDVGGHTMSHKMWGTDLLGVEEEKQYLASSTHHQMMVRGPGSILVGWANENDTEVLFYPKQRCLCFQPHPEYLEADSPLSEYYFSLIHELIGD